MAHLVYDTHTCSLRALITDETRRGVDNWNSLPTSLLNGISMFWLPPLETTCERFEYDGPTEIEICQHLGSSIIKKFPFLLNTFQKKGARTGKSMIHSNFRFCWSLRTYDCGFNILFPLSITIVRFSFQLLITCICIVARKNIINSQELTWQMFVITYLRAKKILEISDSSDIVLINLLWFILCGSRRTIVLPLCRMPVWRSLYQLDMYICNILYRQDRVKVWPHLCTERPLHGNPTRVKVEKSQEVVTIFP